MKNAANMPHPADRVQSNGSPLRVIFVRQQFSPFGGGELILDRTITAMASRGLRVALLGRSWSGRKDIEFIRCDPPRFPRTWRELRFARAACARLATETDTLVQTHERMPCCDIFRAGDGVHAAYLEHRARGMTGISRAALYLHPHHRSVLSLEREMFASSRLKAVFVNSTMVADEIVRHFSYPRQRIHLVPNGIDLSRYRPDARSRHRGEIRERLGTDHGRPVILFAGSGYKRKGLDIAIAAVAESGTDAELWVIGSDRKPHSYSAIAARVGLKPERLRLFGPALDPLPYYAGADVLILPTVYDPFPSVIIEAFACGLPAVTSTACGARDVIAQLDPGLVRDTRDVEGLAQAIRRALELAAKPATIDATRAIASAYGIDIMIDRMLSVYGQLRTVDRR